VVAALVGADRHRVGILLDGGTDNVRYAAVVAQMDHLRTMRLQQPADHVDGRVVTVEQGGGGDEAQWPGRAFRHGLRHGGAAPGAGVHAWILLTGRYSYRTVCHYTRAMSTSRAIKVKTARPAPPAAPRTTSVAGRQAPLPPSPWRARRERLRDHAVKREAVI